MHPGRARLKIEDLGPEAAACAKALHEGYAIVVVAGGKIIGRGERVMPNGWKAVRCG